MAKIYLTKRAIERIIEDLADHFAPDPVPAEYATGIAELRANKGQVIPDGAMPGPALIGISGTPLIFVVNIDGLILDRSAGSIVPARPGGLM